MHFRLGVAVVLRHAKVDEVNDIGVLGTGYTDEEIVGFDVAVDERLVVHGLDAGDHLLRSHADGLDRELTAAHVEQVFQVRSQQVDGQHIVQTLLSEMVYLRHSQSAVESAVGPVLVAQLRRVRLARFKLDGHWLASNQIRSLEDDTEGALADLLADTEMVADNAVVRRRRRRRV